MLVLLLLVFVCLFVCLFVLGNTNYPRPESEGGEASDSGVSVTEENERDKRTKEHSKAGPTVKKRRKFQKSAELVLKYLKNEEEAAERSSVERTASESTQNKARPSGSDANERKRVERTAEAVDLEESANQGEEKTMNAEIKEVSKGKDNSRAGVPFVKKRNQGKAPKKPACQKESNGDVGEMEQRVLPQPDTPVREKDSCRSSSKVARRRKAKNEDEEKIVDEVDSPVKNGVSSSRSFSPAEKKGKRHQNCVTAAELQGCSEDEEEMTKEEVTEEEEEEEEQEEKRETSKKRSKAGGTKCLPKRTKVRKTGWGAPSWTRYASYLPLSVM